MQNSFSYSREYISFLFLFFFTGSQKGSSSLSRKHERKWVRERERERGPEFLETFVILNETVENRSGRLFLAMNACPSGRIYLKRKLQSLSLGKFNLFAVKKKGNDLFRKKYSFLSFRRESRRIKEQLWGKEKKKRSSLSLFSPPPLACSLSKRIRVKKIEEARDTQNP